MSGKNVTTKRSQGNDSVAPTPQNTPASHATQSVLSRPQVPTTIPEDDGDMDNMASELVRMNGANITREQILNNPAFASLVQGRLGDLIGRSSGYVETLPPTVRARIEALKAIQLDQNKVERDFQTDILELEKKYVGRFAPLYDHRRDIIVGTVEPTQEEIDTGVNDDSEFESDDEEDEEDEPTTKAPKRPSTVATSEQLTASTTPKGIPEFWLTTLKNHVGIGELITERDEECLKHLVDIRVAFLEPGEPGFKLFFDFASGPASAFFASPAPVRIGTSDVIRLEKTYFYQSEVGYDGDFIYDHAEGTDIKWKEGKNLAVKVETKKQRNKNTNQTRVVKKLVPTETFFNFFKPPTPPDEDEDEDEEEDDEKAEELEAALELDYQIGEDLKERVIPRAVDFFTGKALRFEEDSAAFSDDFDEDDEDGFEDVDSEDDEESDESSEPRKKGHSNGQKRPGAGRKAPVPPQGGHTPASATDPAECRNQ